MHSSRSSRAGTGSPGGTTAFWLRSVGISARSNCSARSASAPARIEAGAVLWRCSLHGSPNTHTLPGECQSQAITEVSCLVCINSYSFTSVELCAVCSRLLRNMKSPYGDSFEGKHMRHAMDTTHVIIFIAIAIGIAHQASLVLPPRRL